MNGKKRILSVIILTAITVALVLGVLAVFIYYYSKARLNFEYDEMLFLSSGGSTVTEYYANSGEIPGEYDAVLYFKSDPAERRVFYSLEEYTDKLIGGLLAVEDREFYSHGGVNLRRTAMALLNSVLHIRPSFGASTVTQQLIKNISGDNEISIKRKFNEILRAMSLEDRHTKDEILEMYLNIVPTGDNLLGIGTAAEEYFGKTPSELTVAESALLIGIINAPGRYNPYKNPEAAREKRNTVLSVMHSEGVISYGEYTEAVASDIELKAPSDSGASVYPWFIESVNEDLARALTEELGYSREIAERLITGGGLKVYTTMNKAVQDKLDLHFEKESRLKDGLEASAVICDSQTGDIIALYGGAGEKSANRILNFSRTNRAPGSALKPLALYAPLIDAGKITWSSVFDDVPISFAGGRAYPKNYPNTYRGLTTVKDALRLSKNTVAVRLYNMLGADNIYYHLKEDYGFDSLVRRRTDENGNIISDLAPAPLALGQLSYGISLEELTSAYTVFPSEGVLQTPRTLSRVYLESGELLYECKKSAKRIYTAEGARLTTALLSEVVESGTASSVKLKEIVDTAGKTGTSGEDFDRWFIGFTPYYTMGVWIGYPDGGREIGKLSRSHITLWDSVMTDIHRDITASAGEDSLRAFSRAGLVRRGYCKDSGLGFCEKCLYDMRGNRLEYGYFIKGSEPTTLCDRHIPIYYDIVEGAVASRLCPRENLAIVSLIRVEDRAFPKEVFIEDADYVYREMTDGVEYAFDYDRAYFDNCVREGVFVGKSGKGRAKNRYCKEHSAS